MSNIFTKTKKLCPACRSGSLHRSQMRGIVERGILRTIGLRAFRCSRCDERFFRFGTGHSGHADGPRSGEGSGLGSGPGSKGARGPEGTGQGHVVGQAKETSR